MANEKTYKSKAQFQIYHSLPQLFCYKFSVKTAGNGYIWSALVGAVFPDFSLRLQHFL